VVFFDNVDIPAENLIGQEGRGFRYIIDSWNAERILIAAEAIGDARWFIHRAAAYARDRVLFGKPIGANQGVQFPIARASAHTEAADLMRFDAVEKFDRGEKCGPEANMAELLASDAASARTYIPKTRIIGPGSIHLPYAGGFFRERGAVVGCNSEVDGSGALKVVFDKFEGALDPTLVGLIVLARHKQKLARADRTIDEI
jgi:hypothetical protein